MSLRRSLRAKTLLAVLLPTALALVAVAVIALYAYERVARDVIQQRDTELVRLSAARASAGLSEYTQILERLAADEDVQSMELLGLVEALREASNRLQVFDAGVVVYDSEGVAVWSRPVNPRRRAAGFPIPSQFESVRETLRPDFSDVLSDEVSGDDVILIAVPIVDSEGEFKGIVAGLHTIGLSPIRDVYAELLEFTAGGSAYAYLVDGNGRVIYHPDSSEAGRDLAHTVPVMRATEGETGAVFIEDAMGGTIISGYAPVPGTSWGLVTQENWQDIAGPIRGYSSLLLGLLAVAAISSGALVFLSIGRVLRPIQDLTRGARRIAGGDFDYTIAAQTGDEVEALGEQFNVMAEALKESYEDLERRVADRTRELAALNAIAAVVSGSLDLHEILDAALDKTLEVMSIEAGGIYLLKEGSSQDEEGVLTIAAHKGLGARFVEEIDDLKVGEGFSGHVVHTGEPLVVRDLSTDPRLTRSVMTESGFRAVAIVPLVSREEVRGSLFVVTRSHREFSDQDLDLLTNIGDEIGVAIENAQLYEDTKRRLAQVIALQETSRAVASTLELDKLLKLIIQQATALLQASGGIINLVDWENEVDEVVAATGMAVSVLGGRSPLADTLSGWVALHNRPVISNQLQSDSRVHHRALSKIVTEAKRQIQSGAMAPLTIKDQVMGTLLVLDKQGGKGEFDQTDLELLVAFANQAATAIENARLFSAEQRRAEQFLVLSEVGRQITSLLAIDDLQEEIVRLVKETFGYYMVAIGLIEGDEVVYKTGAGPPFDDPQFQAARLKVGRDGITGWVAAKGEPLLVPDVSQEPRYILVSDTAETRSELAVPLKTKSGVIGVLDVQSDHLNGFDESDRVILQSLANQAAIAIEEARLFDAEQRRAEQFRVISEVGRSMTSILSVGELLDEIVRLVKDAFASDLVEISLIDGDELIIKAGAGPPWDDAHFQPQHIQVGTQGITGWVAREGEPILVNDVSQEPRYRSLSDAIRTQSELAVPLKTKDTVIGVLNVESEQLNAFDESDLAVLQSLANQAAIAIENARLYEDTKSRLAQVIALQETTGAVASTLELDKLLNLIIQQATTLLQADGGIITVVDWENKQDEAVAVTGLAVSALGDRATLEGSLSGWVALHNEPVISNQLQSDSRADHRALSKLVEDTKRQIQRAAIAPLTIKDQVMGTLVVLDKQGGKGEFDQTDLDLLVAFANQAATAMHNARLFDAEQRRAEQFRVISEMGGHMTSILDVDTLLGEIVHSIRETLGYYLVGIGLIEGDEMIFKTGSGARYDDPEFQFPRISVGGEGITGWVAASGQALMVRDVTEEPRYLLFPDSAETLSELAVPLRTKSGIIGVLDVQSDQVNAFDESDLAVLQSLAHQAAIAIENAQLYEDTSSRLAQVMALQETTRALASTLELDKLLSLITEEATALLKADGGIINLVDWEGNEDEVVAATGSVAFALGYRSPLEGSLSGWVSLNNRPVVSSQLQEDSRVDLRALSWTVGKMKRPIRSAAVAPLSIKDQVAGTLMVVDKERGEREFDQTDLELLVAFASQAAIAIENARLYEQAQQAAALEERGRLARDLHDAVTQTLFSASLIAEVVPTVWEGDQEEGKELLQELRQLTRGALAEMRTLLLELRPAALSETSLDELLRQLGEAVTGRSGVPVTVTVEGECDLPSDVHVALYRISQEALNNVVKHARAGEVEVSLRCTSLRDAVDGEKRDVVELQVSDDGCGFDPSSISPDRLGLGIIRERAEAIGATLEIESETDCGTVIRVVWKSDE